MPNAIEPIAAQINIAKFNKSVIVPALVLYVEMRNLSFQPLGPLPGTANRD
jgi:hypothetical protein